MPQIMKIRATGVFLLISLIMISNAHASMNKEEVQLNGTYYYHCVGEKCVADGAVIKVRVTDKYSHSVWVEIIDIASLSDEDRAKIPLAKFALGFRANYSYLYETIDDVRRMREMRRMVDKTFEWLGKLFE